MTQLSQPPHMIIPWLPTGTGPLESALSLVWARMHADKIYGTVFHERTDFTFSEFVQFFSRPTILVQLCAEVDDGGTIIDIAGIAWLADFEQLPSHRRAMGSFAYFRKYWSPKWTDTFGKMLLKYWFEDLKIENLSGLTPKPNRAAHRYCQRLGLRYVAELPRWTSFNGKQVAANVAIMDKSEYDALYGGGHIPESTV